MPIETIGNNFTIGMSANLVAKAFFILFLIFYSIFTLILYRQIQLMGRTLPTPLVPFLKFLAVLHIGVALALLFVVIGAF